MNRPGWRSQRYDIAQVAPWLVLTVLLGSRSATSAQAQEALISESVVFQEQDGLLAVEAEHYFQQTADDIRAFYLTHRDLTPDVGKDGDPPHVAGASGGAYLEILPDTRRTHGDKLIRGENFSPEPGKMAVLHYKVHIAKPGRYYVWVRAHSTGSEDNGLHVGIDGTWPSTGQRLQWCQGKQTWRWESKQRTEKEHCGEPYKIYLDIDEPGEHVIHFSMREDGFEFDKWLMTQDRDFERPEGAGPESHVKSGDLPPAYPIVKAQPSEQATTSKAAAKSMLILTASVFARGEMNGYYLQNGEWLAVNPDKHQSGSAEATFPFPSGVYDLVLSTVGENDGRSKYEVFVDGESVGTFQNPLAKEMYQEGARFRKQWTNLTITEGAMIKIVSHVGSEDGAEFSRARWRQVAFEPADKQTAAVVAPVLKALAAQQPAAQSHDLSQSPTQSVSDQPLQQPRGSNGDGSVSIHGELKQWHNVTLDLKGPYAHEQDNAPNPFTDYRMTVRWMHADSGTEHIVPGYFAADGQAADSSAESGNVWRAHFAPDFPGAWSYQVGFSQGKHAALYDTQATVLAPFHGATGQVQVGSSDKSGSDLRAHGRLDYVGKRYLQFAGSKQYFLKVGADAPETLLAYEDFDNTLANNAKKAPLKSWSAHTADWQPGDPTWQSGKGKGLVGAINYLSGKGCNAFSFLTYNAGGDGDNVWPFIAREDKLHYDCSKLDQWGIVFDHGTAKGMYLHFKMQETENDDHRRNGKSFVPECLDGGNLGAQRRLYCRELVARFGHNLALNWNLGEENTQTTKQQQDMIDYLAAIDTYAHPIVVHTFPNEQDKVYGALLGDQSKLTGVSLQNSSLETTHAQTVKWVTASSETGRPWVVAFDESGSAAHAQCPDLGYNGFDGHDRDGKLVYTQHKVRKMTLWGHLMAGGAGNEYYFGYKFDQNDIVCEDWRSRDQSWDYCRIAKDFFHEQKIPFWEMVNTDALVGNSENRPTKFCFSQADSIYLVYLVEGGTSDLDLTAAKGSFEVRWFNPRTGGDLQAGTIGQVQGGQVVQLGNPPGELAEDWLAVIRR